MITSTKNRHSKRIIVGLSVLLGLLTLTSMSQADDVQIYLVPPPEPIPPNVLFILDESGSMSSSSLTPGKNRNVALKDAMHAVINDEDLSNVNAAIMGYTSGTDRIRVMHDFLSMDTPANRTSLKNAVDTLATLSGTPTVNALGLGIEWFKSDGGWTHKGRVGNTTTTQTYTSPLNDDKKYCQKNSIVLLTDGQPNTNNYWDGQNQYPVNALPAPNTPTLTCASDAASFNGSGQCAREMAKWVYDKDLRPNSNWPTVQNVTTHTVSMITSTTAQNFMRSIACLGHGLTTSSTECNGLAGTDANGDAITGIEKDASIGYYLAGGENALADALKSAVQDTQSSVDYNFNTPTIPLNPDNAAISAGYIYVPVFAPDKKNAWKGNLKKYKIGLDSSGQIEIKDANNAIAIDANFKFKDTAQSIWSGSADGNNPLIGGAAGKIYGGTRNIYTRLSNNNLKDSTNIVKDFDCSNNDATVHSLLNVNTDAKCAEVVSWLTTGSADTGVDDANGDDIIDYKFGAPIHTKPIVIDYASKTIVYLPTSDGILHAFDADTGAELWGYIPKELLHDVDKVKTNADNDNHPIYGLDGDITVVHNDADGNNRVNGSEKVLIVFGQRRGGNNYYALDVTSYTSPKYKYQITGGTGTCSDTNYTDKTSCEDVSGTWTETGQFGNLAQTWSTPVFFKLDDSSKTGDAADALIFGGGYDIDLEDEIRASRVTNTIGNSVYIVNAWTGALIKNISIAGMNNSIAANVAAIDVNANGKMERFYAADLGGRIIRIDYEDNDLSSGIIADVGVSPNIKFFNEPTVAYESRGSEDFIALVLGSGNRAEPLDKTVQDSFFMIKDRNVWSVPGVCSNSQYLNKVSCVANSGSWTETYTKVLRGDLTNVTSNYKTGVDTELLASEGWVLDLPTGVKVFSKAAVYDYAVLFTAYSGDKGINADICTGNGAAGESTFYAVGLLSAQAVFDDFDGDDTSLGITDRSKALKIPGLPPSPTLLFPPDDNGGVGGDVISIVGLEEATRWGQRFFELYWEEVIDY